MTDPFKCEATNSYLVSCLFNPFPFPPLSGYRFPDLQEQTVIQTDVLLGGSTSYSAASSE